MAVKLLFLNSCVPSRSFLYGGFPEPLAQNFLLDGGLHLSLALPGASHPQLDEQRGQILKDISSIEAQGSCLQSCVCPGTGHFGWSPFSMDGCCCCRTLPCCCCPWRSIMPSRRKTSREWEEAKVPWLIQVVEAPWKMP